MVLVLTPLYGVQAPARPPMLGVLARGGVGNFRFDYILGMSGKPLFGESGNTLIKEPNND